MKFIATILVCVHFLVLSIPASAATTKVIRSSGAASRSCYAHDSLFCKRDLERRAEDDAIWSADRYCSQQRGQLLRYTASCYTYCNPEYIPPSNGNIPTYVRCQADCRTDCRIP